jgi:ADP-ribosylglycohydrolase
MQIAPVLLPHLREPTTALWSDAALAGAVTHNDYASNGARVAFVALLWDALAASRPVQPASDSNRPRVILGLTEDELPFYDALRVNDAAVKVMGDRILRAIAKELTDIIRKNVTIDWTQRVSARAKLRTMVKRLLRKHGYPPDKQEQATTTVMEQAERLCETWAEEGMLQTSSTGS